MGKLIKIYLDIENTETGTIETGIVLGEYKTPDSAGKKFEEKFESLRGLFKKTSVNCRLDLARGGKVILTKTIGNFGETAEERED